MRNLLIQRKIRSEKVDLKEYITSDQNIYLAIYSVRSYVFDPQLLNTEDKELLNALADPFDTRLIDDLIKNIRDELNMILEDENYFFQTKVYYKPKDYDNEPKYRPIHTADLKHLIAIVALMHSLIYEIPTEENHWKLNLSNYSRLIPKNFYGNRVSRKPEELFKRWNKQYKEYTQKANEYFKIFRETKEYRYELKLDLKNFFPSVDPLIVYGILMKHIPVSFDKNSRNVLKTIIYKLLVCKVTNLSNEQAKLLYYGKDDISETYTKGIAQGLPQSYFFGNICMMAIAKVFDKYYNGKSVYYVDDSFIYTNKEIKDPEQFRDQLEEINQKIKERMSDYISIAKEDNFFKQGLGNKLFWELRMSEGFYDIQVHIDSKSSYTEIRGVENGEIYLRTLSREASQVGIEMNSTYSEEEDETIFHKTERLLKEIEAEMEEKQEQPEEHKSYIEKLERYRKFFKYRQMRLQLKTDKDIINSIFETLTGKRHIADAGAGKNKNKYELLKNGINSKKFFQLYKHDVWQAAMALLIANTESEENIEKVKEYIESVIDIAYAEELKDCNYIYAMYFDYLQGYEIQTVSDGYTALDKMVNKKMIRYANMNPKALKEKFKYVRIDGITSDILKSFGICSDDFVHTARIVDMNSNRLQRMLLNAIYSKIFKVALSDDIALNSYNRKGIRYGELRVLAYLRNSHCSITDFLDWKLDVMGGENREKIDYTIFEDLEIFRRYVIEPKQIDDLIMVHKYTCDVWKNGAKHLYFYTLHNQEHANDLIKNIVKIVKTISYLKISAYDYYLLFISCYLHDISMVRIASENDFLLDEGKSEAITTELEEIWNQGNTKKSIITAYKKVDEFLEEKIRSKHAKESAEEIRKRYDLRFLENSVRESVAQISEGHMLDTRDIYFLKRDAKNKLISYKFDKILLRFADLLDMSQYRVSKPILNHNLDNMSDVSAFHWVSHLLTEGYELTSQYEKNPGKKNLVPDSIIEEVTLSVFVKLSQLSSKSLSKKCKYGKLDEATLKDRSFEIVMKNDNTESCNPEQCNFLCRWFNKKNAYLVQEMQALEEYLNRVPAEERFYKTKIRIKVVVSNPTELSDEQFEVLEKQI